MAFLRPLKFFSGNEVQPLGDPERLQLVQNTIPDAILMRILERGRNDYPIRAMWNSLLAGMVFQYPSIETLRRELARTGQLREMCGVAGRTPSAWADSRFLRRILDHPDQIEAMIDTVVEELWAALPGFAERLAVDSKAIESFAKPVQRPRRRMGAGIPTPTGERNPIAA